MNRLFFAAALAAALVGLARASHAEPILYEASLDGPSESPPVNSPGTGYSWLVLDLEANFMEIRFFFRDLVGTSTVSHIHAPTAMAGMGTVGVATQLPSFEDFPVGVTSGSYSRTFDLSLASTYNPAFITNQGGGTTAGAAAALARFVAEGRAYLNIHSSFATGGEIRGFFAVVPEPSSLVLTGLGAAGAVACLLRRRLRAGPGTAA